MGSRLFLGLVSLGRMNNRNNLARFLGAAFACALSTPLVWASPDYGAYLAGREAALTKDHTMAAGHFSRALVADANNALLQEQTVLALIAAGQVDKAARIANEVQGNLPLRQSVQMVHLSDALRRKDYAAVPVALAQGTNLSVVLDPIIQAWAEIGSGETQQGLDRLERLASQERMRVFALYQKALAFAHLGDLVAAEGILSGATHGPVALPRRAILTRATILANLDRPQDAINLLGQAFGRTRDPSVLALTAQINAGGTPDLAAKVAPTAAVAEAFYTIGRAIEPEADTVLTLIYARMAYYLSPDHKDALLFAADLLGTMDNPTLAAAAYGEVPSDHPEFLTAELGRARMLLQSGQPDAGIQVLRALTHQFPTARIAQVHLADALSRQKDYAAAVDAFSTAITLDNRPGWFLFFARGRAFSKLGDWPAARRDFEAALKIDPNQADVLNFLGYTLLERGEELDLALTLIEAAVAEAPQSAHIRDSLGWAFFKMGRYDEATQHLEQAAELQSTHPEILDHLGDALWAVGRKVEARFHWRRALSFEPDSAVVPRITAKLAQGLDAVLKDEGAPPLQVVRTDP